MAVESQGQAWCGGKHRALTAPPGSPRWLSCSAPRPCTGTGRSPPAYSAAVRSPPRTGSPGGQGWARVGFQWPWCLQPRPHSRYMTAGLAASSLCPATPAMSTPGAGADRRTRLLGNSTTTTSNKKKRPTGQLLWAPQASTLQPRVPPLWGPSTAQHSPEALGDLWTWGRS